MVGCEQRGLQGQVGHGAAPVLGADPAFDGLMLIRVAIYGKREDHNHNCAVLSQLHRLPVKFRREWFSTQWFTTTMYL